MSNRVASGKMAQQEGMQPAVLYKLVTFAILMAVAPIGSYFGTLKYLWAVRRMIHPWKDLSGGLETGFDSTGNTTYSAICAVAAANIVLVGYVVVAFREDAAPPAGPEKIGLEKRKDR